MSPAKRRKILKVVARLPPSGLGSAALPAALADRWAVGGGLWERGISSVRLPVRPSTTVKAQREPPAPDLAPAATAVTAATAPLPRQVTPTDASRSRPPTSAAARALCACAAAPAQAGALGKGTSSSPARRGAQWPPPGPARVHRCLSESRAVPTTQGVLAGGLRHQDLASVLRSVTDLRKWSLRYSTKTSREVIVYSWCRKSGLNSIGQNKERAAWR